MQVKQQSTQPASLLRLPAVTARVGLSRSTLYQKISKREFPAPISISRRAVAWDSRAIDAWIAEKVAQGPKLWGRE